ncbi:MAG: transcription-repair coupling factor, partial [Spirochaetales bacterium]|nr:transcription-repair coupling factor [Spirochaetales bacterium]
MITLFLNDILSKLHNTPVWKEIRKKLRENKYPIIVEGLKGSFTSILISEISNELKKPAIIITPTEQEAENLFQDLSLWNRNTAALFPWHGAYPYSGNPPVTSRVRERSSTLSRIAGGENLTVAASLRSVLAPLPSVSDFKANILKLKKGDKPDIYELENKLQRLGYIRVPRISVTGEFSIRGEIIDINVESSEHAYRILLDYDEISDIRVFDPVTQATEYSKKEITVPPLEETNLRGHSFKNSGDSSELLCHSIAEYFPEESVYFLIDEQRIISNYKSIYREYTALYKNALKEKQDIPTPKSIINSYESIRKEIQRAVLFPGIKQYKRKNENANEPVKIECDYSHSFFGNISFLKEEIQNRLLNGYRIFIFAVYEQQARRISFLLREYDVKVLPYSIASGFILPGLKVMVIQENEIFGRKKRIPRSIGRATSEFIESFTELNPGDYIVHINYGIGIFKGIKRMKILRHERDYIELEYDKKEIIFIPVEQVNLIQRYIVQDDSRPRLDRIGGKSWESRKEKVRKSVEELARRLVKLYSERRRTSGFAFPADSDWQNEFEAGFPYQETEDQLKCIKDVKKDMEKPVPMDRLICGDVGYGKTEIALRAAFKAVMGGKQVALLAPTTILAEQHFETFSERFRQFPVKIGMLSRFRSRKEQQQIIRGLQSGAIDIVIGTHRLVQQDVKFKNIGLLIIDEEQQFGVKHKEIIKEIKTSVDCLTLTATPIPRTLHMSLMKIRDMSILNTPPQNRQPIETVVAEFNEQLIKEAIEREIQRDGQVFYLHNRIKTIVHVYHFLSRLCPDLTIDISHGQMPEDDLEEVMHRFIRGDSHILLATSIIENGLDIPNVNTIIIDRADIFGIAQLYQLRGRVGRSDLPAYAYLLYPKGKVLSELAMKRLKIISDFTELGSGFKIALKDLEIRGAGNLLGREQHGDILAVGLDMYIKLLEEAIGELEAEHKEQPPELYLELEYTGFIPDKYIPEPVEKMEVYKKIAAISSYEELDAVYSEIQDRFGPVPNEVESLFSIAEIRIACKKLYISSLKEKNGAARIEF